MKQGRQSGCKRKAWCSRSKGNRLQRRSETDVPSRKELNNISKKKKIPLQNGRRFCSADAAAASLLYGCGADFFSCSFSICKTNFCF